MQSAYIDSLESTLFDDPTHKPKNKFVRAFLDNQIEHRIINKLSNQIKRNYNTSLDPTFLAHRIYASAKKHNVDYTMLTAIIAQESAFDPYATSRVGAIGLAQVMPMWAGNIPGVSNKFQLYDPATNIDAGAYVFSEYLKSFNGNKRLALLAYNNGINQVKNYLKNQSLTLNKKYADEVLAKAELFN